jgi:hypothetical protein
MTYSQKFGKYGIYTDGMLYRWFKDMDKAIKTWEDEFADAGCADEWLEEYDDVELVDMKSGEVIRKLVSGVAR